MTPYYQDKWVTIYHGDCRELSFEGISSVVTDPPYELGFMGKKWDSTGVSFQAETWERIRGFCLSGAPLLSFGGTRTYHRIAVAIEDAGWEIRDCLMWVYGSGFPKSLNIGKAVDKVLGNERAKVLVPTKQGNSARRGEGEQGSTYGDCHGGFTDISKGNTVWEGYGTALKPAYEPIILGMNPLDGTFAENALRHKVAGLNIDGCRIGTDGGGTHCNNRDTSGKCLGHPDRSGTAFGLTYHTAEVSVPQGRFPANFIHDGSQMVLELFPESSVTGKRTSASRERFDFANPLPLSGATNRKETEYTDNGSAARFFYCAKASKAERDRGCEGMELSPGGSMEANTSDVMQLGGASLKGEHKPRQQTRNNHPTVKPLALMEYLVKLVKMPEYNLILDPFMGSGTTLLACIRLGIPCIGIDNDEHSCEIAARRCSQEVMELL